MSSKYNHHKYETFKHIKPYKVKGKKRGFLNSINKKQVLNNDLLLVKIVNYYSDLNEVLNRVSNDIHDFMFMRFLHYASIIRNPDYFNFMLEYWDDVFSLTLEKWIEEHHYQYIETYKISYVAYFDMKFSAIMRHVFFETLINRYIERKFIPFSQLNNQELLLTPNHYLIDVPVEYPVCLAQELVSQSFVPLLLTKS